jgi:hypothetical protein
VYLCNGCHGNSNQKEGTVDSSNNNFILRIAIMEKLAIAQWYRVKESNEEE